MFTEARGYSTFECATPAITGMTRFRASGHAEQPDVHVFIVMDKLGVQALRALAPVITECAHTCIVYVQSITSHARQEMAKFTGVIETFDLSTVQVT